MDPLAVANGLDEGEGQVVFPGGLGLCDLAAVNPGDQLQFELLVMARYPFFIRPIPFRGLSPIIGLKTLICG